MKSCASFIFLLLTVLSGSLAYAEEPAVVACNLPLTGAHAVYGASIEEAVRFAQEEMGPEKASHIRYDWDDNRSDPKEAVSVLRRQLLLHPAIYLSGVKPEYMAIHDLLAAKNIPHFVWIYDRSIRSNGEKNFRTWVNFKAEAPLILNYAEARKPRKIAILYPQLPHTDEHYLQNVIPGLKKNGFNDILVRAFLLDKTDFRDEALQVQKYGADLIILCGFQENYLGMVRALNAFKLIHDGNTLASYDLSDAAPLFSPSEIEGIHVTTPTFVLESNISPRSDWIARFQHKFGKAPSFTHAYAYDMAMILSEAVRSAAGSTDPDVLYRAIEGVQLQGVTGALSFDSGGDLIPQVEVGVFRSGKIVRDTPALTH